MEPPTLSEFDILRVARADAVSKYGILYDMNVKIEKLDDGWHVKYFRNESQGGAPYYIIDATTGEILRKRYYQ